MSEPTRTIGGLAKLVAWPAALIVAWVFGMTMGDSMSTVWAQSTAAIQPAGARPLALRDVAGYILAVGGALTLVGGGWVAYAQLQFRKISGIGHSLTDFKTSIEKDRIEFLEKYYAHREETSRHYASKAELMEYFQKLDLHMGRMSDQFMKGLDQMGARIESLGKRLDRKGG